MNHLEVVKKYLEKVQTKINTIDLYEAVIPELDPFVDINTFRKSLRTWFDQSAIPEFKPIRGAGIVRIDDSLEEEISESDFSETEENSTTIMLTNNLRIAKLDKRNWALQKKVGEDTWQSKIYCPYLNECLRATARKISRGQIKVSDKVRNNLIEYIKRLDLLENNTKNSLNNIIVNWRKEINNELLD